MRTAEGESGRIRRLGVFVIIVFHLAGLLRILRVCVPGVFALERLGEPGGSLVVGSCSFPLMMVIRPVEPQLELSPPRAVGIGVLTGIESERIFIADTVGAVGLRIVLLVL